VLEDIERTLKILIELSFETVKPVKALIKRRSFFIIYISMLNFLNKRSKYAEKVAEHIKELCGIIQGSYWNNSMCQVKCILNS
jgi:hypothetical protein